MNKAEKLRATAHALLICVILTGCNRLEEGVVVDKHYEPTEQIVTILPLVMSTGTSVTTIMMPYTMIDNEDYVLHIKGVYKGKEVVEQVYTSKECYEQMRVGDRWTKTQYCSFSDNNNVKERRE